MPRSLQGGVWSALNEATFSVGPVAESLRISEVMYHPLDPNAEYIELVNVGREAINLNLVAFTDGVDFVFPDAGGRGIRAGRSRPVGLRSGVRRRREYRRTVCRQSGQRGRATWSCRMRPDRSSSRFRYQDEWYDLTDGAGFSLTVRDPRTAGTETLDEKSFWRPVPPKPAARPAMTMRGLFRSWARW